MGITSSEIVGPHRLGLIIMQLMSSSLVAKLYEHTSAKPHNFATPAGSPKLEEMVDTVGVA